MGGAPRLAGPGQRQHRPTGISPRVGHAGPSGPKQPPGKGPKVHKTSGGNLGKPPFHAAPKGNPNVPGKPPGYPKVKPQIADGIKKTSPTQVGIPGGSAASKPGPAAAPATKPPTSKPGPAGNPGSPTKGKVAQKIDLAKQYALAKKGDVALQLGLYSKAAKPGIAPKAGNAIHVNIVNHVIHGNKVNNVFAPHFKHWQVHHHYCGWLGPKFAHSCFWHHHWGPWYYPKYVLYPKWCPWVSWCWHYHCRPVLDPRPLWCRPVRYALAPRWVYWAVPVWTPLPVVSCGTWVDVAPVAVGPEYDLQLLAIRFVNAGHPEEQLGPQYRVWFRNNSTRAIHMPFNVMLFASADEGLAADSPQAGVRVTSIEAGEVQAVDIRLPIEVYSMDVDENGRPAPFTTLHALVDAARDVPEVYEANNGAKLGREEILPVDPAAFAVEPGTAAAGEEVVLAGEGLGPAPGQVLLVLGEIEMEAEILGWMDHGLRIALPEVPVAGATEAQLIAVRGDGIAANPVAITVTPPALNRAATPPSLAAVD